MRADATKGAMGIADMPDEIVFMILGCMMNLRDVIISCIALCRSPTALMLSRAMSRPIPFLERGAPIEFVRALARTHGSIVPASWLNAAVLGGRKDVIAWLHDVADIDRMHDVDIDTWPTLPQARRKQFRKQAWRLLKMAASRGHADALEWLLDFYDAPRFAAKPVIDHYTVGCLCEWAATSSSSAVVEIIDMLHCRLDGKEQCRCPQRVAHAAVRADRVDVIEWMYVKGCAARPDPTQSCQMRNMVHMAIDAKAHSVIRWLSDRTSRAPIIERLLCEILMPHTSQSRDEAIDMVKRSGLSWSCLVWFWPCLTDIAAAVHGNPHGHPFVRAVLFSLAYVLVSARIILVGLLLFSVPAVGVWIQNMVLGV
ncbi:hypothetical protein pmac_cds_42 [Pandoravirus macleodensis]|uniref:F-box incomplete domain containing protein n=1 Tax=Pandoravirus macleodensis TaxID=2107707 RepID=A0A2U7UEI7_9VIRU|nr:hypothetical protein pmac_cds_42 [Pandoravirus macleodensis]AVK76730.1 hypothetical protein pmac_cds_42 [Pandoravirus macleodensis]